MKRIIKLYDPIYYMDILVMWGLSKKEFNRYIWRRFQIDCEDMFGGEGVYFLAKGGEGESDCAVIGMKGEFTGSPAQHALLAHESLHATISILNSRGLDFGKKSEEAYTYYLGWLIYNITEKMTQVELKIADRQ